MNKIHIKSMINGLTEIKVCLLMHIVFVCFCVCLFVCLFSLVFFMFFFFFLFFFFSFLFSHFFIFFFFFLFFHVESGLMLTKMCSFYSLGF